MPTPAWTPAPVAAPVPGHFARNVLRPRPPTAAVAAQLIGEPNEVIAEQEAEMRLDLTAEEARLVYALVHGHYEKLLAPYALGAQQQTPPPVPDKIRREAEAISRGILQPLEAYLDALPRQW